MQFSCMTPQHLCRPILRNSQTLSHMRPNYPVLPPRNFQPANAMFPQSSSAVVKSEGFDCPFEEYRDESQDARQTLVTPPVYTIQAYPRPINTIARTLTTFPQQEYRAEGAVINEVHIM